MKIYDLDNIKLVRQKTDRELGQDLFYDLTESTYRSRSDIEFNIYTVQQEEEMRIDLVCMSIYRNTDYIDILLNFNEIDNPLNIKRGDTLKFPSINDISLLRVSTESKDVTKALLNKNKTTRTDDTRKKYLEDKFSLPPTVLPSPVDPVVQEGNNIVIGGGLFNS